MGGPLASKRCDVCKGYDCKELRHSIELEYIEQPPSLLGSAPWWGLPILCIIAFLLSWIITRGKL